MARITPDPPPATRVRLPRPDDPTPRRPPLMFGTVGKRRARDEGAVAVLLSGPGKSKGKKGKSVPGGPDGETRTGMTPSGSRSGKGKVGEQANVARLGSGVRVGAGGDAVFKVPMLPVKGRTAIDVTGGLGADAGVVENAYRPDGRTMLVEGVDEDVERANKNVWAFRCSQCTFSRDPQ